MYLFDGKRVAKLLRSGLPDRFLHMEIMLGHVDIRMAHNALNRGQIHLQRLHLADVCVAARMRRQHPNVGNAIQIRLEGIAKIRWITGLPYLPHLPDKSAGGIPAQESPASASRLPASIGCSSPFGHRFSDIQRMNLHINHTAILSMLYNITSSL